ncbi:hypothetical protein [Marinobacter similis]|uniref:hypothetical protein n=1 Tax=Marinobacter similis TaxID=1420916 RepID=UPI0006976CFE|nr:hypothetical protein [Marinobacter similis]
MKGSLLLAATLFLCATLPTTPTTALADSASSDQAEIDRGRYLVKMSGCNDCHTAGYMPSEGTVPESQCSWAIPWAGKPLGYHLRQQPAAVCQRDERG